MHLDTANALAKVLYPVDLQSFVDEYWNRQPLYVSGGRARARELGVSLESFLETIARLPPSIAGLIKAQYFDASGGHQEFVVSNPNPELVQHLLNAGMTICVRSYDRLSTDVEALARGIADSIGIPGAVDVACYVSGPGRGFGLHFDDTPIMVVQCEGTKKWLFSRTRLPPSAKLRGGVRATDHSELVAFLRRNPGVSLEVPQESELDQQTLRENDLLFLPAGTWHRTYAEDVSVALTFSLSSRRVDQELAEALVRAILSSMPRDVEIAHKPSARLLAWVSARLEVIASAARGVSPAALAQDLVGTVLTDDGDETEQSATTELDSAPPTCTQDAEYRVQASVAFVAPNENGDPRVFVYVGDDGVELPLRSAALVRRVLAERSCTESDLRSWSADDGLDAAVVARSLVEVGALVRR